MYHDKIYWSPISTIQRIWDSMKISDNEKESLFKSLTKDEKSDLLDIIVASAARCSYESWRFPKVVTSKFSLVIITNHDCEEIKRDVMKFAEKVKYSIPCITTTITYEMRHNKDNGTYSLWLSFEHTSYNTPMDGDRSETITIFNTYIYYLNEEAALASQTTKKED